MVNQRKLTKRILIALVAILGICFYAALFISLRMVSPFPTGVPVLVIEDQVFPGESPFIVENHQVLLSYNIIKEHFDKYIFWDPGEENITITTHDKTIRLRTDSLTALVNTKPVEISFPVKVEGEPYIPIRLLEDLYGISVRYLPEQHRVVIDRDVPLRSTAKVKTDAATLKASPSWFSSGYTKVTREDTLFLYGEEGRWSKVRTGDGVLGFVPRENLEVTEMQMGQKKPEPPRPDVGRGKISLVWDYIYSITPDKTGEIPPKGLDVISPTWFSVVDGAGNIKSKADIAYIDWAHKNDLAVWALIDNNFDPDVTHEFLSSSETREHMIRQILVYADLFRLDGINIDFENVYLEDKALLVQFVRELAPILREAGIVVSIDVTVKSQSANWSLCYDRGELAKVLDYMMLMAYDEHWAASPVSGSVASIGWVERGIQGVLEEVPPEKLILGLPFYTREWEETLQEGGGVSVKSKALSMAQVKKTLEANKAKIVWDDKVGQNFAYYTKGDVEYKIWLEDEKSIELKTSLVNKYGLAGAAGWRKGFEEPIIWEVLLQELKGSRGEGI